MNFYEEMLSKIEINITLRCNLRCVNCDRMCRLTPDQIDMSVEQVAKFVYDSISLKWKWRLISIIGGEPTLHRDLYAIIKTLQIYTTFNPNCLIQLKTNGFNNNKKLEEIKLKFEWLKICNDEKNTIYQDFVPFNKSPYDIGKFNPSSVIPCEIPLSCGMSLSRHGYTACSAGGTVDRIFGLHKAIAELKDVNIESISSQFILCQHCGHYCGSHGNKSEPNVKSEVITKSWKDAIIKYNEKCNDC